MLKSRKQMAMLWMLALICSVVLMPGKASLADQSGGLVTSRCGWIRERALSITRGRT